MSAYNNIVIIGRLTRDPELQVTPTGIDLCKFSVAVNRKRKDEAGSYPADFFNCIAWRHEAKFISDYFTKGKEILVSGEMQLRSYTNKEGVKVNTHEIVVNDARFCGSNGGGHAADSDESEAQNSPSATSYDDDDPFASE